MPRALAGLRTPYLDVKLPQALLEELGVCSEGGGSHLCNHTNTTASASPTHPHQPPPEPHSQAPTPAKIP